MNEQAKTADAVEVYQPPQLPERMMIDPFLATVERFVSDPGIDPNKLTVLLDQQFRYEDRKAQRRFDEALAHAKAEIPIIKKSKLVGYELKKAGADRTSYWHEDLADIIEIVNPILSRHGLNVTWRTKTEKQQIESNGEVSFAIEVMVTCVVAGFGHREETTISAMADKSGSKNSVQAVGSTQTYLQRYTIKTMLGLAAAKDDDGCGGEQVSDDKPKIGAEQIAVIKRLLKEGTTSNQKLEDVESLFFQSNAVKPAERFEDIYATKYDAIVVVLKDRIAKIAARAEAAKKAEAAKQKEPAA